jgi:HPt (histidine-containing phosphotransfer) domain-containing protein
VRRSLLPCLMLLQSPSLPAFDRARLAEVVRGGTVASAEFLAELRRSTELDAASLMEAARAGESAQVVRIAHRIEGAAG